MHIIIITYNIIFYMSVAYMAPVNFLMFLYHGIVSVDDMGSRVWSLPVEDKHGGQYYHLHRILDEVILWVLSTHV